MFANGLISFLTKGVEAEVHQLNAANFDEFINANEKTLVKFYAPWCGHCKSMAPAYISASDEVDKEGKVKFAEIDVTEHQDIGTKYGVKGFPTIKYFQKGVPTEYEGGRSEQDFLSYIEVMTSDAVTKVASVEAAKSAAVTGQVSFIAVCKDSAKFEEIASANRMLGKFFVVEGDANEIIVVRPDGEEKISMDSEDLLMKIKVEKLPLFGPVSGENFGSYMETGLDMIWYAGTQSDYDKVKEEVSKAAKELRGKFNFVFIDSGVFAKQIEGMLGISAEDMPKLVRTRDLPGKFINEGKMIATDILEWMRKIDAGEIEAVLKSEDIPTENNGPVKTVVGKNFDQIVAKDKDVFLMIHAPWCGHCKKFMPEFEAAAEEIAKKSPDTVMAILDGTANELSNEDYTWSGFPTVYFKKAGSDKPQKYNGQRETAGVLEFLSKSVKTPFEYVVPKKEEDDEL